MRITARIGLAVGLPSIALVGVSVLGWVSLGHQAATTQRVIDGTYVDLLHTDLLPLIEQRMLPLITEDLLPFIERDLARLGALQQRHRLTLQIERDACQAIIAEKESLSADEDEFGPIQSRHQALVERCRRLVAELAQGLETTATAAALREAIATTDTALATWATRSAGVLSKSREPGQEAFARKASTSGSAATAFRDLSRSITGLQEILEAQVRSIAAITQRRRDELIGRKDELQAAPAEIHAHLDSASASMAVMSAQAGAVRASFAALAASSLLVALIIAAIVAQRITRPLRAAVGLAEAVSRGRLDRRLHARGHDELAVLSQTLDRMADSLQAKAQIADAIANGDLTRPVPMASDEDQLGVALQSMADALRGLIGSASRLAADVAKGAGELDSASTALSNGASQQAASLEEISAALAELRSQTHETAARAVEADALASQTGRAAQDGVAGMSATTTSMDAIRGSSEHIGAIIKVIDDIAFQTNLLALNAAVEAARAGRHGKGFAVVADEVRSLAGRSAKAAKETSQLIAESGARVGAGTTAVQATASSLDDIAQRATSLAGIIAAIANAGRRQAEGLDQSVQALSNIESVTQQNAATAEQSSAVVRSLLQQTQELHAAMTRFRLDPANA